MIANQPLISIICSSRIGSIIMWRILLGILLPILCISFSGRNSSRNVMSCSQLHWPSFKNMAVLWISKWPLISQIDYFWRNTHNSRYYRLWERKGSCSSGSSMKTPITVLENEWYLLYCKQLRIFKHHYCGKVSCLGWNLGDCDFLGSGFLNLGNFDCSAASFKSKG